jgi:hypothetical protein
MASRQEEKEARRKARLEQEAKEQRSAARQKRLQVVLGGVLAVGILAAVVIALAGGGGGDGGNNGGGGTAEAAKSSGVSLPAQQTADLDAAVKASGCTLTHPADEGRGHDNKKFTEADYKTNPPTSGAHFPQWAQDGVYAPANTPDLGQLVHTLEHGRINVQYKPGTDPQLVKKLEAFVAENDGYHMLLYQNPTGMKAQVAATTWVQSLTCAADQTGDKMWDALRTFRDRYIDTGPERVP